MPFTALNLAKCLRWVVLLITCISDIQAQCPTDTKLLWYVRPESGGIHRVYRYDMVTKTETAYTVTLDRTPVEPITFSDIAVDPNGVVYVSSFGSGTTVADYASLWRINPTSANTATAIHVFSYNASVVNSLSFDLQGRIYLGGSTGGATGAATRVYRSTNAAFTTYEIWRNDLGGSNAGGDFVIKDGFMYVLWMTTATQCVVYKVSLGTNNTFGSIVATYNLPAGRLGYGMARMGNDLYIGGNNATLYRVTSESPFTLTAVPSSEFAPVTNAAAQIFGLSSQYESYGDFVNPPQFNPTSYNLPQGSTTYNLTTIQPSPATPSGSTVRWFLDAGKTQLVPNPDAAPVGTYYSAFERDGVVGCYSPSSVNILVQPALPVTFGAISASLHNNQLSVSWTTHSETNNDHFEIEASQDGTTFIQLGSIATKSSTSNANTVLSYEFSMDLAGRGIAVGVILFLGLISLKRKRNTWLLLLVTMAFCWQVSGCSKEDNSIDTNSSDLFIRIKQVDVDRNYSYSKTVKVERR